MNVNVIHLTINTNFAGERREMRIILCGCMFALALASAWYRAPALHKQLTLSVDGTGASVTIASEAACLDRVVSKYAHYRFGAIALTLLSAVSVIALRSLIQTPEDITCLTRNMHNSLTTTMAP